MRAPHLNTWHRRRGLTLTELLVVIVIVVTLAALVLAVSPRLGEHQRASAGADLLQQWLLTAKQRALRDRQPCGVRLLRDSANPSIVTTLQFIEQPPEFAEGKLTVQTTSIVLIEGTDLSGGMPAQTQQDKARWLVRPLAYGPDYLQIADGDPLLRIKDVAPSNSPPGWLVQIENDNIPAGRVGTSTSSYRIIRSPRAQSGESPLALPKSIAVDCGSGRSYPPQMFSPGLQPWIDILFDPSGNVMLGGRTTGKIILWVRDVSLDPLPITDRERLITVYTRTGFIASHPVDLLDADRCGFPDNPYTFTQDGRSSGL
jgi:prepilin-type N-terminal cleavage/methylation domain-containing protein